jgi:putative flippase GtrA
MERKELLRIIKFVLFSASAGIIQVATFALFNEFCEWDYWPAYLCSLILSVLWNFTFNRRYTFKSAASVPIAMAKVFGFYLVFTPLSTWLGYMAEGSGINEYIVLAVTMISNLVLEFLFCKFFVYRNQEDTLVKEENE